MARVGALDHGSRPNYHINRSRIILLVAFIIQGYVAYRYGASSTEFSIPTYSHQSSGNTFPSLPTTSGTPTKSSSRPEYIMGSMNDQEKSYDLLVIANKNRYAAKQGYDILWDFDQSSGEYSKDWDRLTSMEKIIKARLNGENDYEWIWWSDYDLIVTNSSISLESVVEEALGTIEDPSRRAQIDIIMTADCFPMNSGSLLLRTTQWSLDWIKEMWRQRMILNKEHHIRSLQDCLGDMVETKAFNIDHKGMFVKQWKINAFPPEIHCHEDNRPWQKGDFVIHMAGAWAHMKDVEDPTGVLLRMYAPEAV